MPRVLFTSVQGVGRYLLIGARVGGDGSGEICIRYLSHGRDKLHLMVEQLKYLLVPCNNGVDLVGRNHDGVVRCRGFEWL